MAKLGDLAKLIRSKNVGPFNLTFDVMFEDEESYRRVCASGVLSKELFNRLYGTTLDDIIIVQHDAARAIKISIPRPIFQSELEDSDSYGGQQYGPLVEIEVP